MKRLFTLLACFLIVASTVRAQVTANADVFSVNGTTASTGAIRLPNNFGLVWRNASNSGNITGWLINGGDEMVAGTSVVPDGAWLRNLGASTVPWRTLFASELSVSTLVSRETITTSGGRVLVMRATVLAQDVAAADTHIHTKHNSLLNGDLIYLEKIGQVEWMKITSGPTYVAASDYSYSVERNKDLTGANDWKAGDAIANTGQVGSGFIDMYADVGLLSANSYKATVLRDSPVLFWRLNDASCAGASIADSSGNGYTGTCSNVTMQQTPATSDGSYSGLFVQASSSYVQRAAQTIGGTDLASDFSIEMWLKATTNTTLAWSESHTTDTNSRLVVSVGAANTGYNLRAVNSAGTQFDAMEGTGAPDRADNTWRHVVYTRNGSTVTLYLNGSYSQQWTWTPSGSFPLNRTDVARRGAPTPASYMGGNIQDVALYTYPLTAEQISAHYTARLATAQDSAIGPTIVGMERTGANWNNTAPRWGIGNLQGLYGYTTKTYGAVFGNPSTTWVSMDATNGFRAMYGASTTKMQIDTSGNATFNGNLTTSRVQVNDTGVHIYHSGGNENNDVVWFGQNDGGGYIGGAYDGTDGHIAINTYGTNGTINLVSPGTVWLATPSTILGTYSYHQTTVHGRALFPEMPTLNTDSYPVVWNTASPYEIAKKTDVASNSCSGPDITSLVSTTGLVTTHTCAEPGTFAKSMVKLFQTQPLTPAQILLALDSMTDEEMSAILDRLLAAQARVLAKTAKQ